MKESPTRFDENIQQIKQYLAPIQEISPQVLVRVAMNQHTALVRVPIIQNSLPR